VDFVLSYVLTLCSYLMFLPYFEDRGYI